MQELLLVTAPVFLPIQLIVQETERNILLLFRNKACFPLRQCIFRLHFIHQPERYRRD
jgi:hypothetical protein